MMKVAAVILLASVCAVPAQRAAATSQPEIRSPMSGDRVGKPGDVECEPKEPCSRIRAEGWVPTGRTPFFVVGPVKASPRKWIQPAVGPVSPNGTFSGLVYLGESHHGARQWFKLYVYACESPDRFTEGDELTEVPPDCEVSEPVEVYRER